MGRYIFFAAVLLMSFFAAGAGVYYFMNNQENTSGSQDKTNEIVELSWEDLVKLDYKTGEAPDSLKAMHQKFVKIPGFFVPLSDNLLKVSEFLLVPNAQACVHVPPPPPNLIVLVTLDKPVPIDDISNPTWVKGEFFIETTESEYGKASYKLKAHKLEEYVW